jgi:hypothetical protein
LTTDWTTYTYTIITSGFGDNNSRVLFDMGGEVGTVSIDDVSVIRVANSTTPPQQTGAVNLYDDAVTGDIVFDSYNPEGAVTATEITEGDRGNVIEIVKTGAIGNWYLNSQATPFDISGYDADSELVFDMFVVSADADVDLYIKLDSGWPNVSDVVVDSSVIGEWQEVRINLQTLLADDNAFSAGAFANAADIINPFVIEPTGIMTVKFDNIRYESTGGEDFDNDGVLNDNDAFPYDNSEWLDSDGDLVGDNADWAPYDAVVQ